MVNWCVENRTCPIDRFQITKVLVFNPIEENVEILGIRNIISDYICGKYVKETIWILSCYNENYKDVISMSLATI